MVVVLVAMTVGSLVVLEAFERRLLSNLDTTLEQQVACLLYTSPSPRDS